ncbi:hypothetical protein POSPLADRAFT_1149188 [Postia placenta MAD-698-R-SB12]|uniref:Dicer-like protein 2 n=1 Tax=Postia placenta MAD-698-R-SB12 TaxID=670580 RepID=A0A1X6MTE9_9APHY|nr:hypothetical protein POSPLADRAFT_1149188 [Postia placenta MAD-698-R-SB12]OSX59637.1 hypothetical protein POSPLADRAFT_1149188 [Postia placenta MAD-698-R-SB12]
MADSEQPETPDKPVFHTRGYQQELLEESLRMNLVIALDTGSGKTHIAVLRMKLEAERELNKISWFLAPTVALVEQQCNVIKTAIPVNVTMISGASEPNQWKDSALWRRILSAHRIIVSTPQILLDALRHGYIHLGQDVGLLVFDEAHHAISKHPYNVIMQEFYHTLPPRPNLDLPVGSVRPMILGLTASPIYGGNVDASFEALEHNLDSTIRSSSRNRAELAQYVHRPIFKHVIYDLPDYAEGPIPSQNYNSLQKVVDSLNIENDPYVRSLRAQLAKARSADERRRIDQKLSKTVDKQDTFCHKGLRDFARAALDICNDLGPWAADWYIVKVIEQARCAANPYNNIMSSWENNEKRYLLDCLDKVHTIPASLHLDDIYAEISPKVRALVSCLVAEEAEFRAEDETYSGLVFVTRRDVVLALAEVLQRLPETAHFNLGCLLGTSSSFQRHSFLDITREMVKDSQTDTLGEFRCGEKNLIISTSVAEEGIDIQACGSVVRFDPPPNVVAWAQSRGRARRKRSSFILMFDNSGASQQTVRKWEETEMRMMQLYNDQSRVTNVPLDEDDEDDNECIYSVPSTGAVLTLQSSTSHLNHFCAVLPNAGYGGQMALYELDPPEYPEDWHLKPNRSGGLQPYKGPWGATVTLPRAVPQHLRSFSTPQVHKTKRSAQRHAAFKTYVELHKAGLLNDHLLPLSSAIEPENAEQVKKLLEDIEKRAGTERVSIQMDPWTSKADDDQWWETRMIIEGLPALRMITRNRLPQLNSEDSPTLYIPGRGAVKTHLHAVGLFRGDQEFIEKARVYTTRLFATLYSAHMKPNAADYCYLFFPESEGKDEPLWNERREWMKRRVSRGLSVPLENVGRANAEHLAKAYGLPPDLALVRPNNKFGKALRFTRWRHDPLTIDEEAELLEGYEGFPDVELTYPLIHAQPFVQRANFLVPLDSDTQGLNHDPPLFLLPRYTTVELISVDDVEHSALIPSILRSLANTLTVKALREELLVGSPVADVPHILLSTALTAPVAQELINYQRLETLGDTVLKYITSIKLFADYPLWHEGYLARRKDHAVSNVQLAKCAISKGLYQWIIRDRFVPRKWRPHYMSGPEDIGSKTEGANGNNDDKKKKTKTQELSTKVLADVVESLIGAAYEHGSFDLAVNCISIFGLGLPSWQTIPQHFDNIVTKIEELDYPPPQLSLVETMLGYEFTHKALLVQALTHASYHGDLTTMSYERLEFLGDSALDMVVTDWLYHAPGQDGKGFKPGYMHIYKEALVNSHFLAFICLRTRTTQEATMANWTRASGMSETTEQHDIYLWQCLLHSSHRVLDDQHVTADRFKRSGEAIHEALTKGELYPWAALTSLQAPKFISDMVESLLGAVFVDSKGTLDAVRAVLRKLGIMDMIERIARQEVDVQHPISRLCIWAAKQVPQKQVKLQVNKAHGNVSCAVIIDDEQVAEVTEVYRSRASQEEVRFAAAEQAIQLLRVAQQQDEWDDVSEYGDW